MTAHPAGTFGREEVHLAPGRDRVDGCPLADGHLTVIVVFLGAAVTAVPALAWLYVLVNRESWSQPDREPGAGVDQA